jgi:glycosyltransferase involved in cell wall biosynthesis
MISLAIIARDNEHILPRLLESVKGVFDEIIVVDTGSTDKTKEVAESYGAKVFDFEWVDDFSAARNFAYSKCTGDWVMWLDTDDSVINAKEIPKLVEQIDSDTKMGAIVMPYKYIVDSGGNDLAPQYRIRLTRAGEYQWKGACHEDLIQNRRLNSVASEDVTIMHHAEESDSQSKLERNKRILEKALDKEKKAKNVDARTVLYYAHTLFGLRDWETARDAYEIYVSMSGWEEDLYLATWRLGMCEREAGNYSGSLEAIRSAWTIEPQAPEAYIQLSLTFLAMKMYEKAISAASAAQSMDVNYKRLTVSFPMEYVWNPLIVQAQAYTELNRYEDALVAYKKLKESNYNGETLDEIIEEIEQTVENDKKVKAIVEGFDSAKDKQKYYDTIPLELRTYPSIIRLRQTFDVKKESSGKDVVIMCGNAYEEWSPKSLETGIGGSEEAVIHMSRELHNKGYNVTVYNTITETQVFDGVTYSPWWEYNPSDKQDIFIGWRYEQLFDTDINADKRYLWLHDVVSPYEYTPERLSRIDKILVLSEYHRSNLVHIPDDKFFITSNGVDLSFFDQKVKRDPHNMVYTSSYDRGLEQLLEMWPEIKKIDPLATLDVYYGWGNFDQRYRDNPERMAWKAKILEMLEQEGVKDHGRVSHSEIAKAMLRANVWAYPTTWFETNCITGLKAQIAGAIPVVMNVGALEETVEFGAKVDGGSKTQEGKEKWLAAFSDVYYNADDYDRKNMMKVMRQKYSWQSIAEQWVKDLL